MAPLPRPRGPVTAWLFDHLVGSPRALSEKPSAIDDPIAGEDSPLALYCCYELHYRGFDGVDPEWEWEPTLLAARRDLEQRFLQSVRLVVPAPGDRATAVTDVLRELVGTPDRGRLTEFMARRATVDQFKEFVLQRSAYHLKESDPHSWAIPRLSGRPKAALVEIQSDEYGGGDAHRIHAAMYGRLMERLGLDPRYGAYLDSISGVVLSSVNLMSLFGLHRAFLGEIVGHLAVFEMTSPLPNRKYANGLRRIGRREAVEFYEEHVEADAVHEQIALHDLAGSLAEDHPELRSGIEFGARALIALDEIVADHLLAAWEAGRSSLFGPVTVTV
ncbi:MAG: iron-containing redox enzyme family protein [Actinomycetota bacterium]|nr:iron-containing redox enzyme family protein [Actinomycetota bacterium]